MLKLENTEVMGWEAAIRGMRNPKNSWEKSDTKTGCMGVGCSTCPIRQFCDTSSVMVSVVGPNDHTLMMQLRNAGTDHRKFMRMIVVYVDITAPLYWWKEFDTYKVGTVANSCSTMHTIHKKMFSINDFSTDHLMIKNKQVMETMVNILNAARKDYLMSKDKLDWWQLIQLLPSSYNQRRTVLMNYEVLANIYRWRKDPKLDEWRELCKWIESLPYAEVITGEREAGEPGSAESSGESKA